ncbi:MAG TPA: ABC transporter substrate-binding protein [Actinomycetes bacterium]|nr:ABC transporter substrate-binding protein [Actinomycetes bacterium]
MAAVVIGLAVLSAGCGAGRADESSSVGVTEATRAPVPSSQTRYPVTVRDCNGTQTYQSAPQRIVTLDDSATDTLVALGLTSRIVAVTKFETPEQEWSRDAQVVATLSGLSYGDAYPSLESIVALRPDIVVSDFPSAFTKGIGPATPQRWNALGVASYETLSDCGQYSSRPLYDFNQLYSDIRNLGVIFNVQARAAALIASLQAQLAQDHALAKRAGLGSYRIGEANGMTSSPGTLGVTTANAIITEAGSTYAFREYDTNPNVNVSWEQVVKTDPDVFWLVTDSGFTVSQMEHFLQSDPQLRTVEAVKNQAYVPISYFAAAGSPRAVDAVRLLVDGLIRLKSEGKL